MDELISAAEANRRFSQLLRGVREGRSYIVTAHGTPVAKLAPVSADDRRTEFAKQALLDRLRGQPATDLPKWSRDELYDDES